MFNAVNFAKWGVALSVSLLAGCGSIQSQQTEVKKTYPNIVFLLVDDLGYSDVGAFNPDTFYNTPNIDALADTGVKFTQGYAASPVCSPSRVAIMTGKHPTRLATTDWFSHGNRPDRVEAFKPAKRSNELSLAERTIAEIFRDNGYATAFMGKWHLGEEEALWPEHQGFDVNVAGAKFGHPPGGYFSPFKNPRMTDGIDGEYLTDRLTDEAVDYIEESAAQDKPFFLFLSYYTVHVPLDAPQSRIEKYKKSNVDIQDTEYFIKENQYHVSKKGEPRLVRVKQNHPVYAGMVESLDLSVGRIINALEAQGIGDDTIIVFTSDNGGLSSAEGSPTSNLPLRGGKGWLYEGGTRVPFIIKAPGQQKVGLVQEYPVTGMDFLPTLTALSGVQSSFVDIEDGEDISLLLRGGSVQNDRQLIWHYPHYANQGGFPGASIIDGHWKLLQNFETGDVELFNLKEDIAEQHNLADTFPDITQKLSSDLRDWYKTQNAEFLRPIEGDSSLPWTP